MAPITPSRKAIMPPPPPPTPKTPSTALVVRRPPGPVVLATPSRANSRMIRAPRADIGVINVKREPGISTSLSTPRRGSSAFPTPPSTSLVRRSRTITPLPRRRASSTPRRPRSSSISSSAAFRAKLAEVRARTASGAEGQNKTPAAGSDTSSANRRSATVEDDDDDEVEFWGGGKIRGSTADVAIDVDPDSDSDDSPTSSPTPSTVRETSVTRSLVRPSQTPFSGHHLMNNSRSERAESTFSIASFGSRATPFLRAPTWDDSDQRYGRTYPRADGSSRDNNNNSAMNSLPLIPPVPIPFTSSLVKASELNSSLQGKHPEKSTEDEQDDRPRMSLEDKLGIVISAFFSDHMLQKDGAAMVRLKEVLSTSNIGISPSDLSDILQFLKTATHQGLKMHIMDYRDGNLYKGPKENRQAKWFNDFRTYLKFSISSYGDRINKEMMEDVLVYLSIVLHGKDVVSLIVEELEDKFDNCPIAKTRKILNALIDLCVTITNIGFTR
ncbi:hypothetical protein I302_108391 [Kwoniella bestiolae CBS 10118]|uniref:Uncharacterized protein n=1 Tax=Kwoniella bestiolae CBS 10118 TaxID=1296100 RepID=A0AAJ8KFF1_9TREE